MIKTQTTKTTTIRELAEYVIYNKVDVTIVSPTKTDQRYLALAFGVLLDNLLPECGQYHSQPRLMELESGSRVWFDFDTEAMKARDLHAVVFENMHETVRSDWNLAVQRCSVPLGMGVRFLGR